LLKGLLLAFSFLTRFPLNLSVDEAQLGTSTIYYPLVGLALGSILVGVQCLLALFFPAGPQALLLVGLLLLMTGGLHFDGLMDTADGLGSGRSREEMLAIMRDSRVGSHGVMAGAFVLLAKYVALAHMPPSNLLPALLAGPLLGRWSMVYTLALYPPARMEEGLGASFAEKVGGKELALATALTMTALLVLWGFTGLSYMFLWALFGAVLARILTGKIHGITGDICGAIGELMETFVWLTLVALP
jgi:adenosylcobinamide-GDP ribazoletransferase